ncbi:MAG: glycosyltransferase [Vicinamibacterales bacterium]
MRPEQKRKEMALADLVLAPGSFVQRTLRQFTDKPVALAPYGVDAAFWHPPPESRRAASSITFICAGQCSLRKGIPVLIDAWRKANLRDAVLELVGSWQQAAQRRHDLPEGVRWTGPLSAADLRARYQAADVDVLDDRSGRVMVPGDIDALVESLRWFSTNRDQVAVMGLAARAAAESCTWARYRQAVSAAVAPIA